MLRIMRFQTIVAVVTSLVAVGVVSYGIMHRRPETQHATRAPHIEGLIATPTMLSLAEAPNLTSAGVVAGQIGTPIALDTRGQQRARVHMLVDSNAEPSTLQRNQQLRSGTQPVTVWGTLLFPYAPLVAMDAGATAPDVMYALGTNGGMLRIAGMHRDSEGKSTSVPLRSYTPSRVPSRTFTPSLTFTQTTTSTKTPRPSRTASMTPTRTLTPSKTYTPTETPIKRLTPSHTPIRSTDTAVPTSTREVVVFTRTSTRVATKAIVASATHTSTRAATATATNKPAVRKTNTAVNRVATYTRTRSRTYTKTRTATHTRMPTFTRVATNSRTAVKSPTVTRTAVLP